MISPSLLTAIEVGLFLFLLLGPCAIAVMVSLDPDAPLAWELHNGVAKVPAPMGGRAEARMAGPEVQPTDLFEIRSFPKGLAVRQKMAMAKLKATEQNLVAMTVPVAAPVPVRVETEAELLARIEAMEEYVREAKAAMLELALRKQHRAA